MKKAKLLNVFLSAIIVVGSVSLPVFAEDAETASEAVFEYILDNSNYGVVEAEAVTVAAGAAEITESANAFDGKAVLIKEAGVEAVKLNFKPRVNDKAIIWMRYSAKDESANGLYAKAGGVEKQFYELPVTGENKYDWIRLGSYQCSSVEPLEVRVSLLEKGIYIDTFVITGDGHFRPTQNKADFELKMDIVLQPMQNLPMPEVFPIEGHPRVLFTKDDIPEIKAKLTAVENAKAYSAYKELLAYEGDGRLKAVSAGHNKDDTLLMAIEALAFSYIIEGNEEHGRRALELCKNMLSSFYAAPGQLYHVSTTNTYVAAVVYDWCYPLLTDNDKLYLRYYVEKIVSSISTHPYPYNPSNNGLWNAAGIISSAWTVTHPFKDDLAFAIASYDEFPDWYNYIASLLINEYAPATDYWLPGEMMPSGSSYGYVRWYVFSWAQRLMKVATGYEPFKESYEKIMLSWIYEQTPEGQYFRSGDDTIAELESTDTIVNSKSYTSSMLMAADTVEDPYLKSVFKYFAQQRNPDYAGSTAYYYATTPVHILLFNDPSIEAKDYTNLPLTKYFGDPFGKMIARTGWGSGVDTETVMAYMYIGQERPTNHAHFDFGSYQLYYKGILLPTLSHYRRADTPHYYHHERATVSDNALLIKDPNEEIAISQAQLANPGNQRYVTDMQQNLTTYLKNIDKYTFGQVTGYEFGPDTFEPEYSYISGDITDAYSDKVDDVRRYMMFMPTDNEEAPAVMMVFDRINSVDASFEKRMLLQAYEEPTVEGNAVTMARSTAGFTGAATNQIVYPENARIEKIGGVGKQWYVEGTNYVPNAVEEDSLELGWGRVEVMPAEESKLDYFLNVIYVHDTEDNVELQKAQLIESDKFMGARLLDKAVMFPKEPERSSEGIEFEIPGEGSCDVAVTGLTAGTWKVSQSGSEIGDYYATEDGGMVYFKASAGKVELKYTSSEVKNTFIQNENAFNIQTAEQTPIAFQINSTRRSPENPLVIKNGTCYAPFNTLYKNLNAEISYSQDGKTATATRNGVTVSYTVGEALIKCSASGIESDWENDIPIWESNGSVMVPIKSSAAKFGGTTTWSSYPRTVNVAINTEAQKSDIPGLVPINGSYCVETSGTSAYISFDNDSSTVWSAPGNNAWIVWELPYEADIKAFVYDSNRGISDRQYLFDLYYSTDGEEYTLLYSGGSNMDGSKPLAVNLPKSVKAKYFKWVGRDNTRQTGWNNVAEMQFYEQKIDVSEVK